VVHYKKMKSDRFRDFLLLSFFAAITLGIYLAASQSVNQLGFPLDDAWIHQTYARNLAASGQFAFIPGQPSAGSTSPLWTFLISAGYLLNLAPLAWTYLLGWACLVGTGWMGSRFGRSLTGNPASKFPWIGLLLVGEWHLVWAAGSGMETGLYAFLALAVFWLLARQQVPIFVAGLICGLAVWVRPDGLTLIGPVIFVAVLSRSGSRARFQAAAWGAAGLLVGLVPYLAFNRLLGGAWWPNTFYAKQAEYAIRLQESLFSRFTRLLSLPWIGVGSLLIPGFLYSAWTSWKKRNWLGLAAVLWWLGYTLIYALTLPVDYQHGRYLIPAMPVFFVLGAAGTLQLLSRLSITPRARLARFASLALLCLVWLAFLAQGALTYAGDVAIIQTEMVATGRWIAQNTPPNALIAAHDIGAIGYFGQRRLLDLAGLISPEVIPFLRDEPRLSAYLDQQGVGYLVTFPTWYPLLTQRSVPIFSTGGKFAPPAGGENMAVYPWATP
jgi:arabinofuranosyltransferase